MTRANTDGGGGKPWSAEMERALSVLWHQGLSDAEIASRLDTTARAVVCKRHRVGLRRYRRDTRPGAKEARAEAEHLREYLGIIYSMARAGRPHTEIAEVAREGTSTASPRPPGP